MSTVPTTDEIAELFDQGELAKAMARNFGLEDETQVQEVQVRCAELHNSGLRDLLGLVENGSLQSLAESDFFMATHFFCQILTNLETTAERIMTAVEALVAHGGKDLAANQPNAAFRAWCAKNPHRAHEVIAAAHRADDLASRHITFALEAINAIGEARRFALTYNDTRRLSAITALGRMSDNEATSRIETLTAFNSILDSEAEADDTLKAIMLTATAAILACSSDAPLPEAVILVRRLVENAGDNTLHNAARILWTAPRALQSDVVSCLLEALQSLNPANKGTVRELDFGLQKLLEIGHDEAAITYVTQFLSSAEGVLRLEDFDHFARTLVSGPSERLSRVVVQWLLTGRRRLCEGLANVLRTRGGLNGLPLELRGEDLRISSAAQVFICRKAIGWFFLMPITAASVLVSVLRVASGEAAQVVQELLVDTLLVNYGVVREYLQGLSEDDAAKPHIEQALRENEAYLESLRGVPEIKELQPSDYNVRIAQLRLQDQIRDARKEAQSHSVLLSIVRKSVLLYGNRSISYVRDDMNALRPVEVDLKSMGVSFEMPRMEIVDPIGLNFMLRVFQRERMES